MISAIHFEPPILIPKKPAGKKKKIYFSVMKTLEEEPPTTITTKDVLYKPDIIYENLQRKATEM